MSQTKAQLISDLVQALNFTGTASAPANGLFLSASNELKLATASNERLMINGDGITVQKGVTVSGIEGGEAQIRLKADEGDDNNDLFRLLVEDGGTGFKIQGYDGSFNTFLTVDTSGRVLIGTTTEGHASADNLTIADSGNAGITIRSGTTSNGCIFFSDATSGDAEFDGFVQYNHGAAPFMQFGVADDTVMALKGINVGIGTTSPSTNLHVRGADGAAPKITLSEGSPESAIRSTASGTNSDLRLMTSVSGSQATKLIVDYAGNVGVGTGDTAPNAKLEVASADSTYALKLTCSENVSGSYNGLSIAGADENSGSYPLVIVSNTTDTHETGGHPILCCNQRRVGIGTLTPSVPLNVVTTGTDAALFESTSGDANGVQLSLRATSTSPANNDKLAVLDFSGRDDAGNNTTYAQIRSHSRDVSNGSEDGDITFHTRSNGSFDERVHIKSDGNVSILGGHLDFANGYGIDFGATSNSGGSMSSELLDDYEEGTWSPILTDDGTSGNSASSYTHQLGWYTKVGNIVNLQCRISGANTTGFNTPHSAFIKNLPFAIKGSSNRLVIGSLMLSNVNLDGDTMGIGILANVGAGSGSDNYHFRLFQTKDNAVWGDIEISQIPSGNHEIQVNFTYRAA